MGKFAQKTVPAWFSIQTGKKRYLRTVLVRRTYFALWSPGFARVYYFRSRFSNLKLTTVTRNTAHVKYNIIQSHSGLLHSPGTNVQSDKFRTDERTSENPLQQYYYYYYYYIMWFVCSVMALREVPLNTSVE
jgi:hypothetical protein